MPRLIINADDFGLTPGVNRAIEEAARSGVLTSTTLMANSSAFDDAVRLAKSIPDLKVGCHVVLVDGQALSSGLTTLADRNGRFTSSLKTFALAAFRRRLSQEDIQREAEAQIRKIQDAGITVTHIDTHKHTHMFPHVLLPVLRAARNCGVDAVRNPFEPAGTLSSNVLARTPGLWTRAIQVALLRHLVHEFMQIARAEDMRTTKGSVGVAATGALDQALLRALIEGLPEGDWELVCHPGYLDNDLRNAGTRLLESRHIELEALTSTATRQALTARNIRLISYRDLQ